MVENNYAMEELYCNVMLELLTCNINLLYIYYKENVINIKLILILLKALVYFQQM